MSLYFVQYINLLLKKSQPVIHLDPCCDPQVGPDPQFENHCSRTNSILPSIRSPFCQGLSLSSSSVYLTLFLSLPPSISPSLPSTMCLSPPPPLFHLPTLSVYLPLSLSLSVAGHKLRILITGSQADRQVGTVLLIRLLSDEEGWMRRDKEKNETDSTSQPSSLSSPGVSQMTPSSLYSALILTRAQRELYIWDASRYFHHPVLWPRRTDVSVRP